MTEEKKVCKVCSPIYDLEYDEGEYVMGTTVKAPRVICLFFEGWMDKSEDVSKYMQTRVFIDDEENKFSTMEDDPLAIILDNDSTREQHVEVEVYLSDAFKDMKVQARLFCECCVEYEDE